MPKAINPSRRRLLLLAGAALGSGALGGIGRGGSGVAGGVGRGGSGVRGRGGGGGRSGSGGVASGGGVVGSLLGFTGGFGSFSGRILGLLLVGARGQGEAQGQGEQSLVDGHVYLPRRIRSLATRKCAPIT